MKIDFEILEKYINNELGANDLEFFEANLTIDKELREILNIYIGIDEAILKQDEIEIRKILNNLEFKYGTTNKRQKVVSIIYHRSISMPLAAIFLLLIVTIFYFKISLIEIRNQRIFEAFYETYTGVSNSRSSYQLDDFNYHNATKLFHDENYKEALPILLNIIKKDSLNSLVSIYIASCYLETGNYNQAIIHFKKVILQEDVLYADQAYWYLGMTYLKANEIENAKRIFKDISSRETKFSKQAREILHRIS